MNFAPDIEFQRHLIRRSKYLGITVISIGIFVLAGWQWDVDFLKKPLPDSVAMSPVTALSFICAGISFLFISSINKSSKNLLAGYIFGGIVSFTGTLKMFGFPVDRVLLSGKLINDSGSHVSAIMGSNSAFCFIASGIALLLLNRETHKKRVPSQYIALLTILIGLLSIICYIYRVPTSYSGFVYLPLTVYSAICFLLISTAILLANPGKGIMKEFTSKFTGSLTLRLLIPVVILVPIIFGLFRLYGYWAGIFTTESGTAILIVSIIVVFISIVWHNGILLNKRDYLKKKTEDELVTSEESFRLLVNNVKNYAIFMVDINGIVTSWNEGAAYIKGYSDEEIIGKHISTFYTAEDVEKGEPELNLQMAEKNGRFEKEGWRKRKDGSIFWADVVSTALYDDKGELRGFAKITRDSTERKKLEDELQEFNQKLEELVRVKTAELTNVFERVSDGILAFDNNAQITYANKKTGEINKRNPKDLIGKNLWDEFLWTDDIVFHEKYNESIRGQKNVHFESYVSALGIWIENHMYPSSNGLSLFFRDITEKKKSEESLRQSEELRQLIMNSSLDAIICIDKNGIITGWNQQAEKVFGWKEEEMIGKYLNETIIPSRYREAQEREFLNFQRTEESPFINRVIEITALNRIGQEFPIEFSIAPIKQYDHEFFCSFIRDISQRKTTEQELRLSADKYKLLFEKNPLPMWMISTSDNRFVDVNDAAVIQYGYEKEEFMSLKTTKIRPEIDKKRYLTESRENIPGKNYRGIWRHQKKDRSIIDVEIYATDFVHEGKQARLILSNDISEKIKAEESLRQSYNEIRQLASHLQNIREEERAVIAREIHDELGQQLTGLKIDISWISKRLHGEKDGEVKQKINSTLELLDVTIKTVRRIATDLRPSMLDDLGLIATIEWQCEEFERRTGITTRFIDDTTEFDFPAQMAIGLFRICQESLTNIARHSSAKNAFITLQQMDHKLLLTITDNGKGFEVHKIDHKKTLGLLGMRERTLMMGGNYDITSENGKGTTLSVRIPHQSLKIKN
jgi:PAS domain S-box-containing protein